MNVTPTPPSSDNATDAGLSALAAFTIPPNVHGRRLLIKGGRVVNPASGLDTEMDILVEDGLIKTIDRNLSLDLLTGDDDRYVQLRPSQWVVPGLIDLHVHFRDPGQSQKETLATGSAAAAAGGFTTVMMMPNTNPVLDSPLMIRELLGRTGWESQVRSIVAGAITEGLSGEKLTDFEALLGAGVMAFTDDGRGVVRADLMKRALEMSAQFQVPLIVHAEDCYLSCGGCMNEGKVSARLGLRGIPAVSETLMVARDIELAKLTGGWVHFTHISSAETVRLIREAKAQGVNVTADVTPHHLVWTDESVAEYAYDPDYKMNPPLRTAEDRQALVDGLVDGTIDMVATDHAPHTPQEKLLPFQEAPFGVVGLETAVGVLLTHFYQTQRLTALQVVATLSSKPAQLLPEAPIGNLRVGVPADIAIIDPNAEWMVIPDQFASKGRNTPFKGQMLRGKPLMTLVGGECRFGEHFLRRPHPELTDRVGPSPSYSQVVEQNA